MSREHNGMGWDNGLCLVFYGQTRRLGTASITSSTGQQVADDVVQRFGYRNLVCGRMVKARNAPECLHTMRVDQTRLFRPSRTKVSCRYL